MANTAPTASCPHCEKRIRIKNSEMIGKKAKCPGCGEVFRIQVEVAPDSDGTREAGQRRPRPKRPSKSKPKPPADEFDEFAGLDDLDDLEAAAPPVVRKKKSRQTFEPAFKTEKPNKKAKQERSEDNELSLAAHRLIMVGTGVIGGLIGAAIWGAIIGITEYEVGYVAILVGFLAGLGVRVGASDWDYGWWPAVTACCIAVLSVIAGKMIGAMWLMAKLIGVISIPFAAEVAVEELGPYDVLWFVLAISAAFKVAAGWEDDD